MKSNSGNTPQFQLRNNGAASWNYEGHEGELTLDEEAQKAHKFTFEGGGYDEDEDYNDEELRPSIIHPHMDHLSNGTLHSKPDGLVSMIFEYQLTARSGRRQSSLTRF